MTARIAFLGIGMMGHPMARRLCKAGYTLRAWNRSPAKAQALTAFGASTATTPAEAVNHADVVICMLESGAISEQVIFDSGLAQALKPGCVLIDMASTQPSEARSHAQRLAALGVAHVDAPVSGGTIGAEAGTLAILCGGDEADIERVRPVLEVLGRPTRIGWHGAGQLAKLANQLIVGVTIGAVAEAMLLIEKGGADPAKFKEAIAGGFADSRVMQVHGQRMIERDFAKRGSMAVQLKDMRNILATSAELGFQAPITQLLEKLYAQANQAGLQDLDQSALYEYLAHRTPNPGT
jgi:3-hydroxyisobutyrate dehydrogenase-like beta-hydroxyacid dehydrogenase